MLSIKKVESSSSAASYFNKDDYYTRDNDAPSGWQGKAADLLGLKGNVTQSDFKAILDGWVTADQRLGTSAPDSPETGNWIHTPGWDMTFSAPKSVSILFEVLQDDRIMAAHDEAVTAALAYAEKTYAMTRVKSGGVSSRVQTGNLVAATFRHDLSRELEPQLHTHAVVANMTYHDNKWMSLHSQPLYAGKMDIGLFYRQELAIRLTEMGYSIERDHNGLFEIEGVNDKALDAFSTRSRQIEQQLKALGLSRATASAAQIAQIALATRAQKQQVDRDSLVAEWKTELGPELTRLEALVTQSIARQATLPLTTDRTDLANQAVQRAIAIIQERQSAFSHDALITTASTISIGAITRPDIENAVPNFVNAGDLKHRTVVQPDRITRVDAETEGYSTSQSRTLEQQLFDYLHAQTRTTPQIMKSSHAQEAIAKAEAKAKSEGHEWNENQRDATMILLTSRDRFVGVQGYAGVAKTTTVLKTTVAAAQRRGYQIAALAPTAAAAATLSDATGAPGQTLDTFLAKARTTNRPLQEKALWILDEATLASTAKTVELMRQAIRFDAKVVFVGDIAQLGSVEAGAAFRQLQTAGMHTGILETIVRQTNADLKAAVYDTLANRPASAFRNIEKGGGQIIQNDTPTDRYAIAAREYLSLTPQQQEKTIVIDPSLEGRLLLTHAIRAGLIENKTLGKEAVLTKTLIGRNLTTAERKDASSYKIGNFVRLPTTHTNGKEAQYFRVTRREIQKNMLTLTDSDGNATLWDPNKYGATAEIYRLDETEFRVGDKVVWTKNDKTLSRTNQDPARVIAVDHAKQSMTIKGNSGTTTVNLKDFRDKHIAHNYVKTSFAAQGRTADRAIIHAESWRINLTNASSFYVQISRAKSHITLITDSREDLASAINGRAGLKSTALDATRPSTTVDHTSSATTRPPMPTFHAVWQKILEWSAQFTKTPNAKTPPPKPTANSAEQIPSTSRPTSDTKLPPGLQR